MTAPTIESSTHNSVNGGTSVAVTFSTAANNEVVFITVFIAVNSSPPGVTSVVAPGLSFPAAYATSTQTAAASPFGGTRDFRIEIWPAAVATAGTYTATVTVGSSADIVVDALWVTNAYDIVSWYDGSVSFPVTGGSAGGGVSSSHAFNYSTAQADDLLLLCLTSTDSTFNTPSGWGLADGPTAAGGQNFLIYSKTNSATQTGASVTEAMSQRFGVYPGFAGVLLAVTADAKAIALQTFVTTICT